MICKDDLFGNLTAKNGYYASLVHMVRDAFLTDELVRIDCKGLERSDYKKIGVKLRVRSFIFLVFFFLLPKPYMCKHLTSKDNHMIYPQV